MHRIRKAFDFAASHQLTGLPTSHPCSRIHGHNYSVELELSSAQLDAVGFVLDYRTMDLFKRWLDDTIDHRHLNDLFPFNPTAENLAMEIFRVGRDMFGSRLSRVAICETPKTRAEYGESA